MMTSQTFNHVLITAKFDKLFDLLHPVGSIMMIQNTLSILGAVLYFVERHLYYSYNDTTWKYLPDEIFIRNELLNSNTHKETGMLLTPSGSNTHNYTTITLSITQKLITFKKTVKKFYQLKLCPFSICHYLNL